MSFCFSQCAVRDGTGTGILAGMKTDGPCSPLRDSGDAFTQQFAIMQAGSA